MPETAHLILDKARQEDWEDMYRGVWSRPGCNQYMFWDLTTDEEAAKERMARTVRWQAAHNAWTVREKESGRAIGFAGVELEDAETAEEQGVCLAPEYWRRGYGTEVLRALTDYAKTVLGAKRFVCRARTDNTASRRLIEKEGFRYIGEENVEDHRDKTPRVLAVYEKELQIGPGLTGRDQLLQSGGNAVKYDFTALLDRRGHDAIAVDAIGNPAWKGFAPTAPKEGFDSIPMWVADMNFPVPKSVQEEMIRRIGHPAFGYFSPSDEYYQAIASWHARRKGVSDIDRSVIGYENGVLGGVVSALKVFAAPGGKVLLHSPTYMGFTHSVEDAGFRIVHSPLVRDENGVWRMDFEDMERKIRTHHIHAAIFCNPHNPCGRVWTKEEIAGAMEVYERNNVGVISDEIWSDLLINGAKYTPAQSVSGWAKTHAVGLYAPSKTFNLAGLIGSYHIIYDKTLRERVESISAAVKYNSMNVLSQYALIGAYSAEGESWLDQLLPVLTENVNLGADCVRDRFEGVSAFRSEGTYMMFLDCGKWLAAHGLSPDELLRKGWDCGVGWQAGSLFQAPECIRLNLASPTQRIREAFDRMDRLVFNS